MKAKKEMKLRNEPQVHADFPYTAFKTKEAWLKEVRGKWTAFYKAFKETKVTHGSYYYPLEVSCWLAAFNSDEINMNRLMDEYCNGISNEPIGELKEIINGREKTITELKATIKGNEKIIEIQERNLDLQDEIIQRYEDCNTDQTDGLLRVVFNKNLN